MDDQINGNNSDHHHHHHHHHHQGEKMEEVMLPGFRFHPTDEELVGFYLKRKIQQRPLSIELIKQLDIYKYDPWDLPKLAATGEKEWYFYCPRDRKYRNSPRPNRVTGAGFWKATGTDRPIYSSEGSKCIGLKKSLVFYKGRAANGVKTDWMMHEFRLPSLTDQASPNRFLDKTLPPNDSWAICRIFKKTNSTAQRALSRSWISPLPDQTTTPNHHEIHNKDSNNHTTDHHPSPILFSPNPIDLQHISTASALNFSLHKPINNLTPSSTGDLASLIFTNMLSSSSMPSITDFGGSQDCNHVNGSSFSSVALTHDEIHQGNGSFLTGNLSLKHLDHDQWEAVRSNIGFPVGLGDSWKPNTLWDSSLCPSEMCNASFSTTKCHN